MTSENRLFPESFSPDGKHLIYREESSVGTASDLHILTFGNETVS